MNYFELYDIPVRLDTDPALLRKKWQEVSRVYHPDRFANATGAERAIALQKSSLNNDAYRTLKDSDATLGYVLRLLGILEEDEKYALPPAFLMEMMELNEAVGNASMAPDMIHEARREYEAVMADWARQTSALAQRFNAGERSGELLGTLKDYYFRKKYLLRLKERLA